MDFNYPKMSIIPPKSPGPLYRGEWILLQTVLHDSWINSSGDAKKLFFLFFLVFQFLSRSIWNNPHELIPCSAFPVSHQHRHSPASPPSCSAAADKTLKPRTTAGNKARGRLIPASPSDAFSSQQKQQEKVNGPFSPPAAGSGRGQDAAGSIFMIIIVIVIVVVVIFFSPSQIVRHFLSLLCFLNTL